MTNRRDFLNKGGIVSGAIAAEAALRKANAMPYALESPLALAPATPVMDAATRELMMEALNASKMAGANPADYLIRVNRQPAASDERLVEGSRVSVTPLKIEGAVAA